MDSTQLFWITSFIRVGGDDVFRDLYVRAGTAV